MERASLTAYCLTFQDVSVVHMHVDGVAASLASMSEVKPSGNCASVYELPPPRRPTRQIANSAPTPLPSTNSVTSHCDTERSQVALGFSVARATAKVFTSQPGPTDIHTILHTSGTTGLPKGHLSDFLISIPLVPRAIFVAVMFAMPAIMVDLVSGWNNLFPTWPYLSLVGSAVRSRLALAISSDLSAHETGCVHETS